jgi:hypothetical protein
MIISRSSSLSILSWESSCISKISAGSVGYGQHNEFKADDSFIQGIPKLGNKQSFSLHGEGMEMSEEEQLEKKNCFWFFVASNGGE